jgi:hypothetical protein
MTTERRQKKHPNLRRGAPVAKSKPEATAATEQRRRAGFQKGMSGNPAGRQPGSMNKATRDVKLFAQSILEDPLVQQRTLEDAQKGRLAPPIHSMLFHYAYGKPKDTLKVEGLERLQVIIKDGDEPEPEPEPEEQPEQGEHHDDSASDE